MTRDAKKRNWNGGGLPATVAGEGVVPGVQECIAAHALVIAVCAMDLSAKALRQLTFLSDQHDSWAMIVMKVIPKIKTRKKLEEKCILAMTRVTLSKLR